MRRFRLTISLTKASPEGVRVQAVGVKVGYWPCLRAPFISICVADRIIDFWWGLPSYLNTAHRRWSW